VFFTNCTRFCRAFGIPTDSVISHPQQLKYCVISLDSNIWTQKTYRQWLRNQLLIACTSILNP